MIPHPDGGGRQQLDPADYPIVSARYGNPTQTIMFVFTQTAGEIFIDEEGSPAMWAAVIEWARQEGNGIGLYEPPPPPPPPPPEPTAVLQHALITNGVLTQEQIDQAYDDLVQQQQGGS